MPPAVRFAGPAGPSRVSLAAPTPAGRVLEAVARVTSPATTSAASPRIVQAAERVPLPAMPVRSPAARVVALAQQAAQSAAPVYRPSGPVGTQAPANRLRGPIFAATAPPPPSSVGPVGPVYASPAAFDLPLLTPNWGAGGNSSSSYADDSDDGTYDVPTFAAAPMQTRSMLGVEAPTSVWWIVAGAGVAFLGYHLYRRDFAGRRP